MSGDVHGERLARVRAAMAEQGVDALLLSVGADLPWLCGYEAMPLERLTMLVVPREGDAHLVVPRLEAPRVVERPDVFTVVPWDETDDPVELVAQLLGPVPVAAIGDRTWARFLVELLARLDGTTFRRSSDLVGPLRAVKDAAEMPPCAPRQRRPGGDPVWGGAIARRAHRGRGVQRWPASSTRATTGSTLPSWLRPTPPPHEPGERGSAGSNPATRRHPPPTTAARLLDITRCVHG